MTPEEFTQFAAGVYEIQRRLEEVVRRIHTTAGIAPGPDGKPNPFLQPMEWLAIPSPDRIILESVQTSSSALEPIVFALRLVEGMTL